MFYLSVSVTVTHICCADFLFIFISSLGWLACFGRMQTGILFSENGDDFLLNKAFDPLWHAVAFRQQTNFFSIRLPLNIFIYLFKINNTQHDTVWDGMLATAKTNIIFIHI